MIRINWPKLISEPCWSRLRQFVRISIRNRSLKNYKQPNYLRISFSQNAIAWCRVAPRAFPFFALSLSVNLNSPCPINFILCLNHKKLASKLSNVCFFRSLASFYADVNPWRDHFAMSLQFTDENVLLNAKSLCLVFDVYTCITFSMLQAYNIRCSR